MFIRMAVMLACSSSKFAAEWGRVVNAITFGHTCPRDLGPILSAVFEDGCGNLVHLIQPKVG
jgi:hypothetical protein